MPARSPLQLDVQTYLDWLAVQRSGIKLIGVGGDDVELPLDNVYVPLAVATSHRGFLESRDARMRSPGEVRFDLVHMFGRLAPGARHALLSGEAGTGKTTALRKLLHQCRDDATSLHLHQDYVPLFARLRHWDGAKHHSLREFFREVLPVDGQPSDDKGPSLSVGTVDHLWDHGKLLLLLDGLDEIADDTQRGLLCTFLCNQLLLPENAEVRLVVSSRPYGYAGGVSLPSSLCTFEIQALLPDDIETLVVRWFAEAAKALPQQLTPGRATKSAQELVTTLRGPFGQRQHVMFSTPLLLTLLCVVVQRGKSMPNNRADFFESCLEVLLKKWPQTKRLDETMAYIHKPVLDEKTAVAVLRPIAYELQRNGADDLKSNDLWSALNKQLRRLKRAEKAANVQNWLYKQAAVLAVVGRDENGKRLFGFAHRSIREYLAALHIAEEKLVGEVAGDFANKWWYDVARLLVTLPGHPVFGPLMRELLATDALLIPEKRRVIRDCVIDAVAPDMAPFATLIADPNIDPPRKQEALRLLMGQHEPELIEAANTVLASKSSPESLRQMARAFVDQASHRPGDEYKWDVVLVFAEPDRGFAEGLAEQLTRRRNPLRVWKPGNALESAESLELCRLIDDVPRALAIHHTSAPSAALLLEQYANREALISVVTPNCQHKPRADSCSIIQVNNAAADLSDVYQALRPVRSAQGVPHSQSAPVTRGPQVRRPTRTQRPQPGQVGVEPVTGMRFVYVPKGTFEMGSEQFSNTQPIHKVTLSGFWLGETPVTNEEYGKYLKANPKAKKPGLWGNSNFSDPRQPVVGVSWDDATAFCQWMQQVAGVDATLPSEAQWEYAARGTDNRPYPWEKGPPTPKRACYDASGIKAPPIVASYPAGRGPFNALDQSGTVWEWCRDVWDEDAYKNRTGLVNPVNTEGSPRYRSIRGGSWYSSDVALAAAYRFRLWADNRFVSGGFRVCLREHLDP